MDITSALASQSSQSSNKQSTEKTNAVDKEFFLKLLITQMKYQDPLAPTDNSEFVSQTAQFTLLEEVQALKTEFILNKSVNLIGKYVEGNMKNSVTGEYETVGGYVDSVTISSGKPTLHIGSLRLSPENITGVRDE
jgi:flagellar basal-body rod modification protein FlgD